MGPTEPKVPEPKVPEPSVQRLAPAHAFGVLDLKVPPIRNIVEIRLSFETSVTRLKTPTVSPPVPFRCPLPTERECRMVTT